MVHGHDMNLDQLQAQGPKPCVNVSAMSDGMGLMADLRLQVPTTYSQLPSTTLHHAALHTLDHGSCVMSKREKPGAGPFLGHEA